MNKLKRLHLLFMHNKLRLIRFISNKYYKKYSYKYFKKAGVIFDGIPKYINWDVNFDLTADNKIFIGGGQLLQKAVFF